MRRLLLIGAALAALTAPATASAMDGPTHAGTGGPMHGGMGGAAAGESVAILFGAFAPARLDILAGDTVHWNNDSVRVHAVNADDGTWASTRLVSDDAFSRSFDTPGTATYYCVLHPFMRGEIDVHRVLLTAPDEPGAPGRPYTIHGRAALPAGESVTIEADAGAGFKPAGAATVGTDGSFSTDIVPTSTANYRAVADGESSQPVQLLVLDRKLTARAKTRGRRVTVDADVAPASMGAPVVLQLKLPQHFGWWPVARAKLDHHSRARFALKLAHRYPARVVLTLSNGATALATSRTLHVGPR
jgi:plastocyanin